MKMIAPPLTSQQLAVISEINDQQDTDGIWYHFDRPGGYGMMSHNLNSFEERREGFLWTIKRLLENGYVRLEYWSDDSAVTGTPEEQIDIIRQAFPKNDDGMDDGRWFFSLESQVGVIWEWPGRDPKPFVD